MPQRTNEFQQLITLLTAALAGQGRVIESAMLVDRRTNQPREVDVVIEAETASYQVRIALETIAWSRPADVTWVERMFAKSQDLPINKLILVSKSGFSVPAQKKAHSLGIETLTIEEATEADWAKITSLTGEGVFEVLDIAFQVNAIFLGADGERNLIPAPSELMFNSPQGPVSLDFWVRKVLADPAIQDLLRENLKELAKPQDFWISYVEPNGMWPGVCDGRSGKIIELRIGLKVTNVATPVQFSIGKFRSVPFVSGFSSAVASTLKFVLKRNADGFVSGVLVDSSGVRSLTEKPADSILNLTYRKPKSIRGE